jgi:ABC-2 type transport system permease protein
MLNLSLFKLSLRQLLGRQRLLLLIVLALIPALIAGVSMLFQAPVQIDSLFAELGLPLVLPLIAMVVSGTLLREEIRNQTIIYLVTKPIARAAIVLGKFAAGLLLIWVFNWLSIIISAAIVGGAGDVLGPLLASATLVALAYGGFFLALSLFFKRALLWSLAYVIIWEWTLANLAPGVSQLSISHYAAQFMGGLLDTTPEGSWSASPWVLLGIAIVSLAFAASQLGRMEFAGEAD